jgi:hydroxypyruvate isomerase
MTGNLQLDLNISITMKGLPLAQQLEYAARLGFQTVEFWWPEKEDLKQLTYRIKDTGLQVALINFDGGNLGAGERGYLNDPQREKQFREHVPIALELASAVGCRRMNALTGKWLDGESREQQLERVRRNIQWTAEQAQTAGVMVLIEALNTFDNGPVIFSNSRQTLEFIASCEAPNLSFQYDVYHMQRMEGNICANLKEFGASFGHIQIADSPGRNQPGTGELNFPYIFEALRLCGYSGYIGLEYIPKGSLEESLDWLAVNNLTL